MWWYYCKYVRKQERNREGTAEDDVIDIEMLMQVLTLKHYFTPINLKGHNESSTFQLQF